MAISVVQADILHDILQHRLCLLIFSVQSINCSSTYVWQGTKLIYIRGLVQSPCGKISVIMTLGGEGVLVRDVLQLYCQQILVVIIHSCS